MAIGCIRKARWVVAWDSHLGQHYFRNDVDVVFDGNRIVHVDPDYAGKVDREIDGSAFCVMPGMVNVHTHLQSESIGRGLIEELGNPALYMTGILDEKSVFVTSGLTDQAGGAAAQLKAYKSTVGAMKGRHPALMKLVVTFIRPATSQCALRSRRAMAT